MQRTATALSNWLQPAFGQTLELRPDLAQLEALSPERDALWARLEKTTFLTTDEKRALIGYPPAPPAAKANPHHIPAGNGRDSGQFTTAPDGEGGDGSESPQPVAGRGGGRRPPPPQPAPKPPRDTNNPPQPPPPPGHNNPPGPIPIPPIFPLPGEDKPRLLDETGQAVPKGFDNLKDLNAFKDQLARDLPSDVSAVMQGSAVEQGGARFRSSGPDKSDFDVSLSGNRLYEQAAEQFPTFAKADRVGPLKPNDLEQLGIRTPNIEQGAGRDVRYMIYPSQIELYKRGPGYPLVTR